MQRRELAQAIATSLFETEAALDAALEKAALLIAQTSALRFYERLGFRAEGPEFDEVGIPHRRMRRRIGNGDEQQAGRDGNTEHPVEPG